MRRSAGLERRGSIKAVSDRRKSRAGERRAITAALDRCELAWHSPCAGVIQGHEVVRRAHYPDGYYDPRVVIGLCAVAHHPLDVNKGEAERLGIRVPGPVWERDGYRAVDEARRVRESRGRVVPYWLADPPG